MKHDYITRKWINTNPGIATRQDCLVAGSYTGIDFLSLLIRKMLHGNRFSIFSFFRIYRLKKPFLQPFNFDKKYKRTKIHVERSVVDNVVVSHYVPKLNERLVQYSSTIVPIFIVSALVDASFSYKDT